MEIREAIGIVETIREHIERPTEEISAGLAITALTGAIEALQKQLPKKPIEIKETYTSKIGEFKVAKCQNYGKEVSDRFNVCLECRQSLDWSVENE